MRGEPMASKCRNAPEELCSLQTDDLDPAHRTAVVEATTTTVLLRGGDRATVTPFGWLDIAVGRARRGRASPPS